MYLYVAYDKNNQITKIGRTKNIERRISQLKDFNLRFSKKLKETSCKIMEISTHKILRGLNLSEYGNEYFNCAPNLAVTIINSLSTISLTLSELFNEFSSNEQTYLTFTGYSLSAKNKLTSGITETSLYNFYGLFHVLEYRDLHNKPNRILIGKDFVINLLSPDIPNLFEISISNSFKFIDWLLGLNIICNNKQLPNILNRQVFEKKKIISPLYSIIELQNINIEEVRNLIMSSFSLAWYSGDLGENREKILLFLRSIYGGLDATNDKVINVGQYLGINARIWYNHDGNFTIEHRTGLNRNFSLTLYTKDESPSMEGSNDEDKNRVSKLIRWDCTFNQLLYSLKLRKVCDLEKYYKNICDEHGYDIGFTRHIAKEIQSYLKLDYFINLTRDKMIEMTEIEEETLSPNMRKLYRYWYNYGKLDTTDKELADKLGIPKGKFSTVKAKLKQEFGLDVEIPRTTHEAVLDNRSRAQLTEIERGERILNKKNKNHNTIISDDEMFERDTLSANKYSQILNDVNNSVKIRKFQPVKITNDNIWVLKKV